MTFEICGIGECMIEFCALEPLGIAKTMQRSYGGDVLNALVAAQRLGSKSAFITRVGNDPFGLALMHAWQAEGINIDQVSLVDGQNGVYFISLQENGEREFSYYRTNSAASQITPADLKPKVIASSSMLLISGITQAISQSAQSTTLQAARIAREAGNTVVFDPNYRPKLWEARGGIQVAREAYQELIPYVDILLPSNPADLDLLEQTNLAPRKVLENLLK